MTGGWLRDSRTPPQAVLKIIEGYLHRVACPVYLGAVSLYIGWSLERTEQMMRMLQDRGLVRPLTIEEKVAQKFRSDANIWCLVGEPMLCKAKF